MKIYLISPTHYTPDGNLVKSVHYWTSAITLPYLKALTPREHEVTFTDELFHDVDVEHRRATSSASPRWGRRSRAPTISPTTSARAARRW